MHVGLYSPVWPPGDWANGIVTYVEIVRSELRRRGHRVTLFSGRCETSFADGVVRVASGRRAAAWASLRRRAGFKPDVLHEFGQTIAATVAQFHSNDPLDVFEMEESFGWCHAVAKRLPIPTVVKLHGPAFLSLIDGIDASAERLRRIRREGEALRLAAAVVSPSPSTLRATAEQYQLGVRTLSSIPNPVAVADGSLLWRADRADPNDILFIGRFDFRKGGDAVLHVFDRIARLKPMAHLTFVGPDAGLRLADGRLQHFSDYLRASLPADVAGRVRFLGLQPFKEILRLRTRAAVTVTATRWESFGYVVAEAMMQGCPVVGFDVAGVNELIEHERTGLLAPLDDLETLARHICRVMEDPALAASLGRRARESVIESCGVEVVVDRMLSLYEGLIGAHRQRRRP